MPSAEENVKQLKARNQDLQHELSERDRQYELRGRELNAERKKAARVDELEEEVAGLKDGLALAQREANDQRVELESLRAAAAKAEAQQEDLAALKRLVS